MIRAVERVAIKLWDGSVRDHEFWLCRAGPDAAVLRAMARAGLYYHARVSDGPRSERLRFRAL